MFATALIVFREVLEAALVIAIVLGASQGILHRGRWVAGGLVLGLVGAGLVAAFASDIANAYSGTGQARLNAGILLMAVGMLTWHNVWMASHGRTLAAELRALGSAVRAGQKTLLALLMVTFMAVLREGSELVLFLWAIAASGGQRLGMTIGGIGGLAGGILVGSLLYRSLLFIPLRHFFTVTRWLILLLASGLAAQAAAFLNQAGVLPAFGTGLWNTSGILNENSAMGQLLHILVGYVARPSGIELAFYAGTLLLSLALMRMVSRADGAEKTGQRS